MAGGSTEREEEAEENRNWVFCLRPWRSGDREEETLNVARPAWPPHSAEAGLLAGKERVETYMGKALLSTWLATAREAAGREVPTRPHTAAPPPGPTAAQPRGAGAGRSGDSTLLWDPTHAHER